MKIKRYELIIEYDPDSDEIESINECIIEDDTQIYFIGNIEAVDVMDDDSIRCLNSFIIGEC